MTQKIIELRILPPFAIARLGSADDPMDNYTIELDAPDESGSTARLPRAQASRHAHRRRTVRRNRGCQKAAVAPAIQDRTAESVRWRRSSRSSPSLKATRPRLEAKERARARAADGRPPERERIERQRYVLDGQRRQSQGGPPHRRRKRRGQDRQGGPAKRRRQQTRRGSRRGHRRRSRYSHLARALQQLRVARERQRRYLARCASSSPTRSIPRIRLRFTPARGLIYGPKSKPEQAASRTRRTGRR